MAIRKPMEVEVKVGLFVSIGVGLILASILVLGGADTFMIRQARYPMHFPSVEGLIPGAKVVLGGLTVGTVESVDFDPKTKTPLVVIAVNKKYEAFIKEDTQADIATQGVLGDKYIALNAGSDDAKPIASGTELQTKPVRDLSQMFSKGDTLMVSLNQIASSLDRLLKSFEAGNRNEIFFQGLATTARNLAEVTGKMNKELDNLKLRSSMGHLHDILEKINNGTGTVGALVNDPGLYYDARTLLGGANRNRIVRNLVRQTVREGDEAEADAAKNKKK